MFITTSIRARHLSLSQTISIQSMSPCPSSWKFILILPSHLHQVFQVVSFPQVSPPRTCMHISSLPYVLHAPPISFFFILSSKNYLLRSTEHKSPRHVVFSIPCYLIPLRSRYLPQHPIVEKVWPMLLPQCERPIFTYKTTRQILFLFI